MNITIHVYPNSSESWAVTSPITGVTVPDHLIFYAGSPKTTTVGTLVGGRLLEITPIDRGVDILGNRGLEDTAIKGIGGISKTADCNITLYNHDDAISIFKLLGRSVKVCIVPDAATSLNYVEIDCLFTGYIKEVTPSSLDVVLCLSDSTDLVLHKVIGTELLPDKICPIHYGDFTYPASKMSSLYIDKTTLHIDSETLEAVSFVQVYDTAMKEFYSMDQLPVTNTDKNEISLVVTEANFTILNSLTANVLDNIVTLYNPPTRAYLPSSDVSGVAIGDYYGGSFIGNCKVIQKRDGYLILEDLGSLSSVVYYTAPEYDPPPATGTLYKHSGSGPASFSYSYVSETISPFADYEFDMYDQSRNASLSLEDSWKSLEAPATRCLIRVDNEIMQVIRKGQAYFVDDCYTGTDFYVARCVLGTTLAEHLANTLFSLVQDSDGSESAVLADLYRKKYIFSHTFKATKVAGMNFLRESEWLDPNQPRLGSTHQTSSSRPLVFTHEDLNGIGESGAGNFIRYYQTFPRPPGPVTTAFYESQFYIEFRLPATKLDATVVDMFLQGKVETELNRVYGWWEGDTDLQVSLSKGGVKVPVYSDTYPGFVGHFMQDTALVYHPTLTPGAGPGTLSDFYTITADYPCAKNCRQIDGSWMGQPLRRPFTTGWGADIAIARQRIGDQWAGGILRNGGVQWFDTLTEGRTPIRAFSAAPGAPIHPDGLTYVLDDMEKAKYSLGIRVSTGVYQHGVAGEGESLLTGEVSLEGIGFLVVFAVDLTKMDNNIWVSGKGRVNSYGQDINYPTHILQHLLTTEYGAVNINVSSYSVTKPNVKTTLALNGPRRVMFDSLEDFCKKHCLITVIDSLGRINIQSCLPEMHELGISITLDNSNLIPEWSQSYTSVDGLIKKLTLKYAHREADKVYTETVDSADYTNEYEATNEVVLENPYLYEGEDASWLVEKLLDFYRRPIRIIKTKALLGSYQIGYWATIDSVDIPRTADCKYLLINTSDRLPVEGDPYTELTLLELITVDNVTASDWQDICFDLAEIAQHQDTYDKYATRLEGTEDKQDNTEYT